MTFYSAREYVSQTFLVTLTQSQAIRLGQHLAFCLGDLRPRVFVPEQIGDRVIQVRAYCPDLEFYNFVFRWMMREYGNPI